MQFLFLLFQKIFFDLSKNNSQKSIIETNIKLLI